MIGFLQTVTVIVAVAGLVAMIFGHADVDNHRQGTPKAYALTFAGLPAVWIAGVVFLGVSDHISTARAGIWLILLMGSLGLAARTMIRVRQFRAAAYQIHLNDLQRMQRSHGDG